MELKLDKIILLLEQILMTSKELLAALDAATTAIGARLQALLDKINTGDEISDADKANLAKDINALNSFGADPNNPIPPVA